MSLEFDHLRVVDEAGQDPGPDLGGSSEWRRGPLPVLRMRAARPVGHEALVNEAFYTGRSSDGTVAAFFSWKSLDLLLILGNVWHIYVGGTSQLQDLEKSDLQDWRS